LYLCARLLLQIVAPVECSIDHCPRTATIVENLCKVMTFRVQSGLTEGLVPGWTTIRIDDRLEALRRRVADAADLLEVYIEHSRRRAEEVEASGGVPARMHFVLTV